MEGDSPADCRTGGLLSRDERPKQFGKLFWKVARYFVTQETKYRQPVLIM